MIRCIALIGVLLPVLTVVYVFWLGSKYGDAYEQALVGSTTEARVRELAGSPSYVTDGTRWLEPKYVKTADQLVRGCVNELWYAMPWPLLQRFSFCFDRDGLLVDKYNWVSW